MKPNPIVLTSKFNTRDKDSIKFLFYLSRINLLNLLFVLCTYLDDNCPFYDLYGIVNYSGSGTFGHYMA